MGFSACRYPFSRLQHTRLTAFLSVLFVQTGNDREAMGPDEVHILTCPLLSTGEAQLKSHNIRGNQTASD